MNPTCCTVFTSESDFTCGSTTVCGVLTGGVSTLSAVPVLPTWPASMSACVTLHEPVQARLAPGASVAGCTQVSAPSFASAIVTPWSVTLPAFVAVSA